MFNLKNVIKFEIMKQLRKPSFWISIFIFPLMMLIFGGVGYLNVKLSEDENKSNRENITSEIKKDDGIKVAIFDKSDTIDTELLTKLNIDTIKEQKDYQEFFKNQTKYSALIVYQKDLVKDGYNKYLRVGKDKESNKQLEDGVGQLSKYLLTESANKKVDAKTKIIISGNVKSETKIYDQEGDEYNPIKKMIVPGIFLATFFLIFIMSGNQMLVAVTEEKENRTAEMILTSIKGQSLIVGKIIALIFTSIVQMISIVTPMFVFYFVATRFFDLPPFIAKFFDDIIIEFWPIFFGAMFLMFGFLMVTSITILIGSLFPTAQEAGQFYGPIIMTIIMPFYFLSAITAGSNNFIIQFLSYFPTSSTLTMLIRNASGNLTVTEGFIGLGITILFTIIAVNLAVRAFKSGLFEYSKKLSLKSLFKK